MAVLVEIRIILLFTIFSTFVDCQITSSPTLKDVCVGDNVDIDWVYGNAGDFLTVTWAYIDSQTSTQTTIMQQTTGGTATVVNNYNAEPNTKFNGGITLTSVTKANSGSYKISVNYITASAVDDTVNLTVKDCTAPPAPSCKETCKKRVIASIVFGILGMIALVVVVIIGIVKDFSKPVCLTVAVLCIVFDIISLALSASVLADDDCKDCEDWILNSAIAFVVIPSIVAVTAIVLTILVLLGVIGPGRNGITKEDLRPWEEIVREKLLHELESAYPNILSVKDLIRKVDAEESVVMEQLEELKRKDLIRQLDSGGFVRHFLDVKTGITKKDLRPLEETVCEKLLHVLESVYPNILSVKDLIRIDFAEESVVMEQLEELRRKDLIKQLDSGGFVRHFLDVKTAYKAKEAKEPGENDRLMETSN